MNRPQLILFTNLNLGLFYALKLHPKSKIIFQKNINGPLINDVTQGGVGDKAKCDTRHKGVTNGGGGS